MVLGEFKQLIEFQALNPQKIIQMFDPEFSFKNWMAGVKVRIMSKDQEVSVANDLIVFIFIAVVLLMAALVGMALRLVGNQKIKTMIDSQRASLVQKMVWNGMIGSLKLSFFKNCIAIGNQLRLLVLGSEFLSSSDITVAALMFLSIWCLISFISLFLWRKYQNLDHA